MEQRVITVHALCSAKGGVGKSALAVAAAKLLAHARHECVLIDADLTGTSLADGLRLCSPDVAVDSQNAPDLFAPQTGRHLSRDNTVALRHARSTEQSEDRPPRLPFLNDLLVAVGARDTECRVAELLWRHEEPDGVGYLPSSPLPRDIEIALGWLYREESFAWLQRVTWLLDGMREQMPTLRDVVIDLPPGLFGFAHETLALLSNLRRGEALPSGFPDMTSGDVHWKGNPVLVITPDMNDLALAIEYYVRHRRELPHLRPVINRYSEGRWILLRQRLREHFNGVLLGEDVDLLLDKLQSASISDLQSLRGLFVDGKLRLSEDVLALARTLGLEMQ